MSKEPGPYIERIQVLYRASCTCGREITRSNRQRLIDELIESGWTTTDKYLKCEYCNEAEEINKLGES
jgi:hypothetical protein